MNGIYGRCFTDHQPARAAFHVFKILQCQVLWQKIEMIIIAFTIYNHSTPINVFIATTSIIRSLLFPKQEMWRLKPWLWLVSSRRNKSCVWFFWQFQIFSEILKNHEISFLLTMKNIFAGAVNVGSVLINGMAWTS